MQKDHATDINSFLRKEMFIETFPCFSICLAKIKILTKIIRCKNVIVGTVNFAFMNW